MYRSIPQTHSNKRVFIACLLAFTILMTPIAAMAIPAEAPAKANPAPKTEAKTDIQTPTEPQLPQAVPAPLFVPEPSAAVAASLSATLTDDILLPAKKNPGDTINYTATITNAPGTSPTDDASSVVYTSTLDTNTTLVAGSINVSPLAFDDAYSAVGNTLLEVGNATAQTGPQKSVAGSVTTNDVDFLGDQFEITAFDATGTNGGTITMVTSGVDRGSFTYISAADFTGTDTFTYTIRDDGTDGVASADDLTGVGTVTITVANKVWYVDSSFVGTSDGRSTTPYKTLAEVSGNSGADDVGEIIYLNTGTGDYTGGITLLNNQTLHGEGTALVVDTFTLAAAGPDPTIANAGGNGITLGSGNTLTGLTIGNTSAFDIANTTTATVGSLNISNVNLTGTGGLFRADSGGALTVTFDTAGTTSATGNGIQLGGALTGSFTVTAGAISGVAGTDVLINGGTETVNIASSITSNTGGSIDIGSHSTNNVTLSGAINITGGTGISVHNNTSGIIAFTNASKVVNTGANNAVDLDTNTGATVDFTGGGLDIDTTSGTGFEATAGGIVTVQGSSNTITTTSGTALNLSSVTVGNGAANGIALATVTTTSAANGILISSVLQGASSTGIDINGGSIAGATTRGVDIDSTQADVAVVATISTSATGRSVEVTNSGRNVAGGSQIVFSAAIDDNGLGINLDNNDQNTNGAVVTFSGGLDIDSTTNSGFSATNGGTVNATQNNTSIINTVDTSTGIALNVVNTTIGASDLTFRSISSNGASSGIVLNTTGSSGGLTVTGDAGITVNSSGGTIQNTTGHGIALTTTSDVSLDQMSIQNTLGDGINGSSVTNFNFTNSTIAGAGSGANEYGTFITNLFGTGTIDNVSITNSQTNNLKISNNAATAGTLTITDSIFTTTDAANGGDCVNVETGVGGAAVGNLTVNLSDNNDLNTCQGDGIQAAGNDNSTLRITVDGSNSNYNGNLGSAVNIAGDGNAQIFALVQDLSNVSTGTTGTNGLNVINIQTIESVDSGLVLNATVQNNSITTLAGPPAGQNASGIRVIQEGRGILNVNLNNNTIGGNLSANGIVAQARAGNGQLNMTVGPTNAISLTNGVSLDGVSIEAGSSAGGDTNTICLNMLNNSSAATGQQGYRLRKRATPTFQLQNFAGNGAIAGDVTTWVNTTKSNTGTTDIVIDGGAFTNSAGCATATLPLMAGSGGVEAYPSSVGSPSLWIGAGHGLLTQADLDVVFAAAIERWTATGLTTKQIAAMRTVKFEIADLPGVYLAEVAGDLIRIDRDAAGYGWFIDATAMDDLEFVDGLFGSRRYTNPISAPAGHIDLLTAIEHEIGHKLGLGDSYSDKDRDNIMYGHLTVGERRLPARGQAAIAIPGTLKGSHFLSLARGAKPRPVENRNSATVKRAMAPMPPVTLLNGEPVNVTIGTLPAGKTLTIKYAATISATPTANSASTQGTISSNIPNVLTSDPDPGSGGGADATVTNIAMPDLTITKSHSGTFKQGDTGKTYTITPRNNGDFATFAGNTVTITDTLPAGLTPTAPNGLHNGWTCNIASQTLTCTRSDSVAAATDYPTITLTVDIANNAGTPLNNTVNVTAGSGGEVVTNNNSFTDPTTIVQAPDLTIDKSHIGNFFQGQTGATYSIIVRNLTGPGPVLAGDTVTVTDTFPAGLIPTAPIGAHNGWTCGIALQTLTCTRSDALAVGASYPTITATVDVAANAPTGTNSVTNTASVSGGGELNTANNSDSDPTTINTGTDLIINKSHTDIFTQSDTGRTYSIQVTNVGGTASSGTVTVTDALPVGLTATAPIGLHNGWTCTILTNTLSCTRSEALGVTASYPLITLTVDVASNAPPSVTNTATVSGGNDVNLTNNSDDDLTTINPLCSAPPMPANMVGWWTGDNTERDVAGGHDGTPNGGLGYAAAKVLNGFSLDGTDDYVSVPDSPAVSITGALTVDAWINPDDVLAPGGRVILSKYDSTTSQVSYVLLIANGKLRFTVQDAGGTGSPYVSADTTTNVSTGVFTHVAATFDPAAATAADKIKIYLNGVADTLTVDPGSTAITSIFDGTAALQIGAYQNGTQGFFDGIIDEVELFNVVLTPAQILALYNADAGGKCKPSDLKITKTHTGNFLQNSTGNTYTIKVHNDGPTTTSGVVSVLDSLPAGLTATGWGGTGWTCNPVGAGIAGPASLTCSRSNGLAAGGDYPDIILTVTTGVNTPSVTNTVTVSGGGQLDTSDDSASDPTTLTPVADLSITKTDGQASEVPGTAVSYTIVVTNNGPSNVTGATVADTFPATILGVTYTSVAAGGATGNTAAGAGSIGDTVNMPSGSTITYTVSGTISSAATVSLANTATVTAPGGTSDPNLANNSATDTDTLTPTADLQITKTDGATDEVPGTSVTYTITVTNAGPSDVTGATVADTFPATITGVNFTSVVTGGANGNTAAGAGNINDTVNMPAGSTITYTATGTISSSATVSLANTATVTAPGGVTDAGGNNSATDTDTLTPSADLQITKTDGATDEVPGTPVTYTITVTNAGPSDVTGATVADVFPATITGVNYTSLAAGGATGNTAAGAGNINDTVNMPAGSTITYTATGTISSSATVSLANTATVTAPGGTTDPNSSNNSATDTDTLTPAADLQITKTDGAANEVPGTPVTYTITVTNAGPSDVIGATVADVFPATITGVNYTSIAAGGANGNTAAGSGNINDTVNMPSGSTITYTATGTISPSATVSLANTATVTAPGGTTELNSSNNSATDTDTLTASSDLQVTSKTDTPDPVTASQNITYAISFQNNGPSDAQGVTITDAVPAGTTFVSAQVTTGSGWTIPSPPAVGGTGNVVFSKATVASGETATFEVVVKVNNNAVEGSIITNNAVAASATNDPNGSNNTGTATTTVNQSDIEITSKTDTPDPVAAGNNITYTVNFKNNSAVNTASNVTVTDAVPVGTTLVSATTVSVGWARTDGVLLGGTGNIVFSKALVAASETATFTIVVKVNANALSGSTITNTATAATTSINTNSANNSASATTTTQTSADLAITSKTDAPDPVIAGNNITYTINFINNGPSDAQTVTVTDAVPANTTYISASITSGTGWTIPSPPSVGGTGNVVFSKATVAAGETATFQVVVKVNSNTPAATIISNDAVAASATTDPTPGNNTGNATTTVVTSADLSVTKIDSPDPVIVGTNLTYTITVTNNGSSDAQNLSLSDTLPPNTTFVSFTVPGGWTRTDVVPVGGTGTVTATAPTLAAGANAVFTLVVNVNLATPHNTVLTNSATVTTTTVDPNLVNNTGTTTTTVTSTLALTVNDSGDAADTNVGDRICDTNAAPGDQCTLRAAIQETNAAVTADTIGFSLPANTTITLTGALDGINGDLVMTGPASGVTVDGNNLYRVFNVVSGNVSILNLTIANGRANQGGGIFNSGNLTLNNNTFTGNNAVGGTAEGGAIYSNSGALTILNSTISGNTANGSGGGLNNNGTSTATLVNVTVTNNRTDADGAAPGPGGGIAQSSSNPVTLRNTIVAGNFTGVAPGTAPDEISGNMAASSNNNLVGAAGFGGLTNGVNNNQVGVADARLAPLANNGGPTQTHALLAGATALDAGDNTTATNAGLTTDQRGPGFARSADGPDADATATVDIGAFEAQVWVQDILDRSIPEDGSDSFSFNVGGIAAITTVTATSSNTALVPNNAANLSVSGSGSTRTLTIIPVANQNGSTIITVTVNSASGSMTDTFVFTVWEVNDAPTANSETLGNTTEDSGQRTIPFADLTGNDSKGPANESGQTLIVKTVSNAVGGTVGIVGGNVIFTPTANYNGPASFDYTVEDNGTTNGVAAPLSSGTATANWNITTVNDAPDAVNDALSSVAEDSGQRTIPIASLMGNDNAGPANESGQTLTFALVNASGVGGTISSDATNVYFTPTANFNGPASFQYTVTDNGTTNGAADPKSDTATVSFTIWEVNDAPTAVNDTLTDIAEDSGPRTVPTGDLLVNDSQGPPDETAPPLVANVGNAVGGTVTLVNGVITFTPTANYSGPASFEYQIEDNDTTNGVPQPKVSNWAIASFNITPQADAPSVTNATTNANTQTTSGLVISRNPADGAEVTHFKITGITGGALFKNDGVTPINNGNFITFAEGNAGLRFTPGTSNGSFTVQASTSASDAGLQGGTATATITVNITGGVIRFSTGTYSVAEGAGFRLITVERTGDVSQAVTVDYASSDHSNPADFIPCTSPGAGFASSRCDFTTAIGTLRFAANETSKTFNVLITDDNYVEGTETLDLTLSNPTNGAVFGVPSTAVLSILDDTTEPATNLVDNSGNFVRSQYHDFLNREPDAPGLAFWIDNIDKCNDPARIPAGQTVPQCIDKQRESTAVAFFMSPEYQMTGGFTYRLTKGSLTGVPNYDGGSPGRFPTSLEFMRDVSQVSEGIVVNNQIDGAIVEANRNRLAADFVQRPEFVAKYGGLDNTLYVEELFNTTTIPATAGEKQALVDGLTMGTETRASVLRKVVDGTVVISEGNVQFTTTYGQAFYNQEFRRVFVYMEYIGYLRRNPDAPGFNHWLGKLNFFNGDPFAAEMVRAFILSPEYRSRFGQP